MKANAQKIAEGVYWIGVLDWDLRSYHGYTLDGTRRCICSRRKRY